MSIITTERVTPKAYAFTGGDWTIPSWQGQRVLSRNIDVYRNRTAVPKFREIIRNGGDATGPYSRTWWMISSQKPCDVSILFKYPKYPGGGLVTCEEWARCLGPYNTTGMFTSFPSAAGTTYYTSARNKALSYLYQRNADLAHAFQGGVFAGELRETWRMLKDPIRGLKKGLWGYLDDVQNKLARNRGHLMRLPKQRRTKWINNAIADSWLTATLGFLPLCRDIDDALKALSNLSDASESYGLTATGSAEGLLSTRNYLASLGNYIRVIVNERSTEQCSVRFKVGFRLTPPQVSDQMSVQQQLSLTLRDFVPTVWNLIPGSFLYDYVTNIGDVLDAFANPIIGYAYAVESIKTEATFDLATSLDHARIRSNLGTAYVASGGESGSATAVAGRFERKRVTGALMPSLQVSLDLSDRQLLNVAALLQKGNFVKLATFGLIK